MTSMSTKQHMILFSVGLSFCAITLAALLFSDDDPVPSPTQVNPERQVDSNDTSIVWTRIPGMTPALWMMDSEVSRYSFSRYLNQALRLPGKHDLISFYSRRFLKENGLFRSTDGTFDSISKSVVPVVSVNGSQAAHFCQNHCPSCRLPTVREWEQAARCGRSEACHFAVNDANCHTSVDAYKSLDHLFNYDSRNDRRFSREGDGHRGPAPMRHYKPNNCNFYDLSGNVGEWCHRGKQVLQPVKGGSWYQSSRLATIQVTESLAPSARFNYIGFRCIRTQL